LFQGLQKLFLVLCSEYFRKGEIGISWNSKQMAWAYGKEGSLHFGINKGEDFIEDL
jgi:hypothetical protein